MNQGQDRVRESLHRLIQLFKTGDAPKALAVSVLPPPNIPASRWSLGNKLVLWFSGTGDARGYRQWRDAERFVRRGAHAIYILAPSFRAHEEENENGEKVKKHLLSGFRAVPVFRFEDTDGAPLQPYLDPPEPPPLADVAETWGLTVRYVGCSCSYLGLYRHNKDRAPEITLATHAEQVFFHELAHAAQYRVWPDPKLKNHPRMEISAELAACVLARLYGRQTPNEGDSYSYVTHYCDQQKKPLARTLWSVVADTEKILNAILAVHKETTITA